jgi:hypothetical protein
MRCIGKAERRRQKQAENEPGAADAAALVHGIHVVILSWLAATLPFPGASGSVSAASASYHLRKPPVQQIIYVLCERKPIGSVGLP